MMPMSNLIAILQFPTVPPLLPYPPPATILTHDSHVEGAVVLRLLYQLRENVRKVREQRVLRVHLNMIFVRFLN